MRDLGGFFGLKSPTCAKSNRSATMRVMEGQIVLEHLDSIPMGQKATLTDEQIKALREYTKRLEDQLAVCLSLLHGKYKSG